MYVYLFTNIFTGVLGASIGETFLQFIGIKDPITIGLSLGASAHGLGAASMSYDPVKFASAVVSMTLTGLWTVVFLSLMPIKTNLVKFALF